MTARWRADRAYNVEATAQSQREARFTKGLGHPNICDTVDFGSAVGQPYLVMEWLDGETLDARMTRAPLEIASALEVGGAGRRERVDHAKVNIYPGWP